MGLGLGQPTAFFFMLENKNVIHYMKIQIEMEAHR